MVREQCRPAQEWEDTTDTRGDIPMLVLRSRDGGLGLHLDTSTGLPVSLFTRGQGRELSLPLAITASLVTGGAEARGVPGAVSPFEYTGTAYLSTFRLGKETPLISLDGPSETYSVRTQVDGWVVVWKYTFRRSHPRLEVTLDVGPLPGSQPEALRDLRIELRCHLPDLASWLVEAPGNQLRAGVAAGALRVPVPISPAGGSRGSAGMALIHRHEDPVALLVWPFFEPHWLQGSPDHHPLVDQHPDWFLRDSAGNIIGRYTKAFDVANVSWQEYFADAAIDLVRRLDIDGFRFDAPTYNMLPNWSPATERRASYSPLGCLELFRHLRTRIKSVKDSFMLYTEPSGALFRHSMDITYNYDEQWLIDAVLNPSADEPGDPLLVRNGREMAAWFRDRNSTLPRGSVIAHHVDSHDTFWWPLPGEKWQREQYGLAAVRALLAVYALSGGAFMTFVGGELGVEEDMRRINRLRTSLPEIARGAVDYESVRVDRDEVYALVRQNDSYCAVLLVNLSDHVFDAHCTLDLDRLRLDHQQYEIVDALRDGRERAELVHRDDLRRLRCRFDAFQSSLLLIRPVAPN